MSKMYISTVTGIRRTDNQPFESNTLFASLTAAETAGSYGRRDYLEIFFRGVGCGREAVYRT